jgi:hypothetical protein
VLVILGISSLIRFSHGVRAVDVVGLSGGGAACGAALYGFIFALMSRNKA